MKYVHQDYKTKEVIVYIDDLIVNGNVESFSDLTYTNKCILSGMLLKCEPLTEILNFISQNGHDEEFQMLLSICLQEDNDGNKIGLFDHIRGYAVDYYEPTIESILNERLDDIDTF